MTVGDGDASMTGPFRWYLFNTRDWDEYDGEPGILLQLIYRGDAGGYVLANFDIPVAEWRYERARGRLLQMLRGYRDKVWTALAAEASKPQQLRLLEPA